MRNLASASVVLFAAIWLAALATTPLAGGCTSESSATPSPSADAGDDEDAAARSRPDLAGALPPDAACDTLGTSEP